MNLALALTLATAFIALFEIFLFTTWRNSGKVSESAYPFLIIASASLPFVIYLVLTYVLPDVGAIEVL